MIFSAHPVDLFFLAIPIWLYAEIHYRFKFIPSRLYYPQPEIIADAPHRIDPGRQLPVLLLIKEGNRFPIELLSVTAFLHLSKSPHVLRFTLHESKAVINLPLWWQIFYVDVPNDWRRQIVQANIEIIYRCGGREFRCYNDNHVGTSHAPLRVYMANEALPSLPGFVHGDLHCHTDATSDQVEFGAPVEAMVALAPAQGLNFFAATDHSYDLDDLPDNYLKNDPELRKWQVLQERITRLNAQTQNFVIIPGEEVSTGNSRRRNVHFLIFNSKKFFPGSGDSAERWFRTEPEMAIDEILAQLEDEALTFAAHPEVSTPPLEWLLLRRGKWQWPDYRHPRLNGLQIWNGSLAGMAEGAARWRELLLAGKKIFIIAGNDAHGNFNRFRQVGLPHLKMREHHWHLFGRTRTTVWLDAPLSLPALMQSLRVGRACLTTGPVMDLQIIGASGRVARLGETIAEKAKSVVLQVRSAAEFGELKRVVVWLGDLRQRRERVLFETSSFAEPFSLTQSLPLDLPAGPFYLRGEAHSAGGNFLPERALPCRALTNPIWVEYQE